MSATEIRIRNGIIKALNEAQHQHRLMKKQYNKQKGFLRIKGIYFKVSDFIEVRRRTRKYLHEEKMEKKEETARKKRLGDGNGFDRSQFYRLDLAMLSNAKTAQLAKELSDQTKRITQQIREEQGGLFRGFRRYKSSNRKVRKEMKRAAKVQKRKDKQFRKDEKRKEKKRKRIHKKLVQKRFKIEVRDERLAKYELARKRKIAKELGYW